VIVSALLLSMRLVSFVLVSGRIGTRSFDPVSMRRPSRWFMWMDICVLVFAMVLGSYMDVLAGCVQNCLSLFAD